MLLGLLVRFAELPLFLIVKQDRQSSDKRYPLNPQAYPNKRKISGFYRTFPL